MKTKMNRTLNYVKKHKPEFLIGTGTMLLVGVGVYMGIKSRETDNLVNDVIKTFADDLHDGRTFTSTKIFPDLGVGIVEDAMRYDCGTVELMMDNMSISDLGKLGEGITDNIKDVPENAAVWALISIREGEKM